DSAFHRTKVAEHYSMQHVICRDGKQILQRVQPLEVTARFDSLETDKCDGRRTPEIETAHCGKAAGIKAIVDRSIVAKPTDVVGIANYMAAGVIWTFRK